MILDYQKAAHIFIVYRKTDLRKGIDGLAAIVQHEYNLDVYNDALFLFCGGRRDRFKMLYEDDRLCVHCETLMIDMGTKRVRDEISFHQARIETLQHVQHSYCCKACERTGETSLKKAPVPKPLLQNSLASPSVVSETIRLKFKQKVPAYRQEEYWQQLGLDISRDNISNWHI